MWLSYWMYPHNPIIDTIMLKFLCIKYHQERYLTTVMEAINVEIELFAKTFYHDILKSDYRD